MPFNIAKLNQGQLSCEPLNAYITAPRRTKPSTRRTLITVGISDVCRNADSHSDPSPHLTLDTVNQDRTIDPALSRRSTIAAFAALVAFNNTDHSVLAAGEECELKSTPSGIEFCDKEVGKGNDAIKGTLIRAHYTGRLATTMEVFDSSYPRGRPLVFTVGAGQVIKGWDLGILGTDGIPPMKPGGKRRLVIPPELAYGSRGAGRGLIPPDATLIFDVEYLGVPSR